MKMKIKAQNFNLKETLESGQFFRYKKEGAWYYCFERDTLFKIRQSGTCIEFSGTTKDHIVRLFGLDEKYEKSLKELGRDKTLARVIRKYKGLRIMRRDPWETLISFQASIMSNIKKIKLNMELIAKAHGKKLLLDNISGHTFPKPGELKDIEKLKACSLGFRAKYIHAANNIVTDKKLKELSKKSYGQAKEELMKIPGIADKVADCICLFSLGHTQAFPVDVWIERAMQKYFKNKKAKPKDIRLFAQNRWGKNAGLAQQFIYHEARNENNP
ncbi:hypothetical protein D6825_02890 [Candidatus Woesearchaeota archaeon]|nr:MAG: hypothetical protein D6825_02890 [Candidatus Woesearchaeota archaeon]